MVVFIVWHKHYDGNKVLTNIIHPTTNLKATKTLTLDRGDGVYVYDNRGKQYLEGMSGLWCTASGYNNTELIEAVSEKMSKLSYTHLFDSKTHSIAIELADKISKMVPDNAKVFFGNSGSDRMIRI